MADSIIIEIDDPVLDVGISQQGPPGQAEWPEDDGAALAAANRFAVGQESGGAWTWVAKTGTQLVAWLATEFASLAHTQAATTLTLTATDTLVGRQSAGAGAAEEISCSSLARTILSRATAALMRGDLAAYRIQTPGAGINVTGASVAPSFGSNLTQVWTLTGNVTSLANPTGLEDGETGVVWATLGSYGLPASPPSGGYKGAWTVTGPLVRIVIKRVGSAYLWSADSLSVVS